MKTALNRLPGILLAAVIALPAWWLGKQFPIIGAPVIAMVFGILLASLKRPAILDDGIRYTARTLLQYAIILLGFGMDLFQVFWVGTHTCCLMGVTLVITLATAFAAGRLLKIEGNTTTLIGVGTAICGGSAIAATAPIIGASDEEITRAISTIFLFNLAAAFLFPFLGHTLHMTDDGFGLWTGTAVNDTSSVVAAGYTFSETAGDLAVIVKLTRTLMIVPITLLLALHMSRQTASPNGRAVHHITRIFPWFILGFVITSLIGTFTPEPFNIAYLLAPPGKFLIAMAMASIGLNTRVAMLLREGGKPILLGLVCWFILSLAAWVILSVTSLSAATLSNLPA
ncbi:MAG: YeiH family protein [Burkholderiaceae bacterium]|jgi:uncharacterized integral membrane protein (TIGR00698 family)|nr:YeiH family protein [Burkholderiaceae bacterium]